MIKGKEFLSTTAIGGIMIILPIAILCAAVVWIYNIVIGLLSPIVAVFPFENQFIDQILAIITMVIFSFLVGLIVKTTIGQFAFNWLEGAVLEKLPLYTIIKDTLHQFASKESTPFQQVVLAKPYSAEGAYVTGFVTDTTLTNLGNIYTIFVPTGPNPTSGQIFHLPEEKLILLQGVDAEVAMKSVVGCGAGSSKILVNT